MKNNQSLKITIITVVFNGEKILEKTIQSVVKQTYQNIEYIIIDGGSNDKTLDIIKKYEKHIYYWISESDKGIYDAMNKGIKRASGDYVYFLNAGDALIDKDVIKKVAGALNRENASMLHGNVAYFDPFSGETVKKGRKIELGDLKKGITPSHQATFIKRKTLLEFNGFNTQYSIAADFELFCRLYKKGVDSFYFDKKIAYYDGGGVSSNQQKCSREKKEIIKKHFGYLSYSMYSFKRFFLETLLVVFKKIKLLNFYYKLKYKYNLNIFK